MIEIMGRIACLRLIGTTTFVKSNSRPTQLELSISVQTKFVIYDHTIDITYVRMATGFMYLTAIIDWYSRYVLAWQLSNTLDNYFCLVALDQALAQAKPEIFNTDQGVQFTAHSFTSRLEQGNIQISMDGRGRALDNVFVERLWRSVKYEHVYLHDHSTVLDLHAGLTDYFEFYNHRRFHQSLDDRTPAEVYFGRAIQFYVN